MLATGLATVGLEPDLSLSHASAGSGTDNRVAHGVSKGAHEDPVASAQDPFRAAQETSNDMLIGPATRHVTEAITAMTPFAFISTEGVTAAYHGRQLERIPKSREASAIS
jgi:hypothetical protein